MVRLLAEQSDTKSNVKLGGFWSQHQASYMSSHTEELCLWMTTYIYIYIYIYICIHKYMCVCVCVCTSVCIWCYGVRVCAYGPISQTIQVRWIGHAGHSLKSKEELISNILLRIWEHGQANIGQQQKLTYISSVQTQDAT